MVYTQMNLVEVENISRNWKRFHIVGLFAAALFGIISGISLSMLYEDSEPLCGSASLSESSDHPPNGRFAIINGTYVHLVVTASEGYQGACSFSEYTFICSFIFAIIWKVFFFMCGPGGKSNNGLPQPWRIVPPATVFSGLFFFIALGAASQVSFAFKLFCSSFDQEMALIFNKDKNHTRDYCQDVNMFGSSMGNHILNIDTAMKLAEIGGWLCVCSWAFTLALCLARLLTGPDFQPLLKAADKVISAQVSPNNTYKELKNSSSTSVASSPSSIGGNGAIIGTSQVDIHCCPSTSGISRAIKEEMNLDNASSSDNSDNNLPQKRVTFINPDGLTINGDDDIKQVRLTPNVEFIND